MVFAVGAADDDGVLRAVAMVGRPVARHLDNRQTLEVTRTATDGAPNANSMLYGAAWRAAQAMGYTRLVTYTQEGETGVSLRAAGWRVLAQRPPRRGWDCASRPRQSRGVDNVARTLWEAPTCCDSGHSLARQVSARR
ncbi:XF1762 family protein [Actinacidiphila sp. bgisy160]|uniref:XF1762 family protein n=1 Tax=Actinacidiphila sp. bgisy160 TaxID=3413796 RepID=UPI003D74B5A1